MLLAQSVKDWEFDMEKAWMYNIIHCKQSYYKEQQYSPVITEAWYARECKAILRILYAKISLPYKDPYTGQIPSH